jgi:hypothetical protein
MGDVTQTEAWKRGVEQALALEEAEQVDEQTKTRKVVMERGQAIMRDTAERAKAKRATEPIAFCCAEGCGLTCQPGQARCWIHLGARSTDEELRRG